MRFFQKRKSAVKKNRKRPSRAYRGVSRTKRAYAPQRKRRTYRMRSW